MNGNLLSPPKGSNLKPPAITKYLGAILSNCCTILSNCCAILSNYRAILASAGAIQKEASSVETVGQILCAIAKQVTKYGAVEYGAVESGTVETLTTETRGWGKKDSDHQSSNGGEKLHDGIEDRLENKARNKVRERCEKPL